MSTTEFSMKISSGITLNRELREEQLLEALEVKTRDMNNGYTWHDFLLTSQAGSDINFSLCFHEAKLESISLSASNSRIYGHGWDEWSVEKEKLRAIHTEQWLSSIGYTVGTFKWGKIWVGYDAKSGWGHGVIRYAL